MSRKVVVLLICLGAFWLMGFIVVSPVQNVTQNTSYSTIQAAVDAANPGDVIQVSPGTYTEKVTITKSLTLKGPHYGVCANDPTDLTQLNTGRDSGEAVISPSTNGNAFTISAGVDNVTIDGFKIAGGTVTSAIYLWNGDGFDNINILNNYIQNIEGWGVFSGGANRTNWTIDCNRFDGWSGVDKTAVWLAGNLNQNTIIENNFFRNGNPPAIGSRGVILDGAVNAVVQDNVFQFLNRYGVQLNNGADGVQITNNTMSNLQVGIQLLTSGSGPTNGALKDVIVDFNKITDMTAIAIYLSRATTGVPPPGSVENLSIRDNTITQDVGVMTNSFGLIDLRFDPSDGPHGLVEVLNNEIFLNGTFVNPVGAAYGIRARGSITTLDIIENHIDCDGVGTNGGIPPTSGIYFQLDDSTFGPIPQNAVITSQHNVITNCSSDVSVYNPINPSGYYVSSSANGNLQGSNIFGQSWDFDYYDEDVLYFDGYVWAIFFDGSAYGLASNDIDGFAFGPNGTYLFSLESAWTMPGGIPTEGSDVIQFNPQTETFSLFFDGSDVGLSGSAENIDALHWVDSGGLGTLYISTSGTPLISGVSGAYDEDILKFTPTQLGATTKGTWSMYLDGSGAGVKLSQANSEDTNAFSMGGGTHYLSALGTFDVGTISGEGYDVFNGTRSSATSMTYSATLTFDGASNGFVGSVDAFAILGGGG